MRLRGVVLCASLAWSVQAGHTWDKRQAQSADPTTFDGVIITPTVAIPHMGAPTHFAKTNMSTSAEIEVSQTVEISSTPIGSQSLTQSQSGDTVNASITATNSSCSATSPQGALQCLISVSDPACLVKTAACASLRSRLGAVLDDKTACATDASGAASACAGCGGQAAARKIHEQHVSICDQLKASKKSAPSSGDSKAQAAGNATSEFKANDLLHPVSPPATPTATIVTAATVVSAATAPLPPALNGPAAAPKIVLVKIVNGSDASSISQVFETAPSRQIVTVTQQQQLTSLPVVQPTAANANRVALGADGAHTAALTPGTTLTTYTPPIATLAPAAAAPVTAPANGGLSSPTVYQLALDAANMFFQSDIDPSCAQADDGCEDWRQVLVIPAGSSICGASMLRSAIDCSACVSAAGKSDQSTYVARNKAYGWFKGNCSSLDTQGSQNGQKQTSPAGLLALESVAESKPSQSTSMLDRIPIATAAAPVQPVKAAQPVIQYVYDGGAGTSMSSSRTLSLVLVIVAIWVVL